MPQADDNNTRVAAATPSVPKSAPAKGKKRSAIPAVDAHADEDLDIDYDVNELRKATRILSCVAAYHLEYPEGPRLRSDYNQYVQNFSIDPVTLMGAVERVAEMVEDLYSKVCDPTRVETP